MKKILFSILIILLLCLMLPAAALADAGPKPSITVKAVNMPDALSYMDILVTEKSERDDSRYFDEQEYNQNLIQRLKAYSGDGWYTTMTYEDSLIFGGIHCNVKDGACTMRYSYRPPDRYRIIVVTEDGGTVVSNIIERKNFDSTVYFDYATGEAREKAVLPSLAIQFITTCLLTLLVEGLVLLLFRFTLKKSLVPFLVINIVTQLLLFAAVMAGMMMMGAFGALIFYVLAEFAIFILECVLFAAILKEHTVGRRIAFAAAANVLSFVAGLIMILIF
ncbi:MAG: hypothetical protein JXB33_05130 [Clostridia bacterium]|nr:hypothetical protein [Clostridia bacterium]